MIISLTQTARQNKKSRRGFTLIEAIIVITVLGILAAVIVPRIANITTASEEAVAAAEEGRVNALIEQIYAAGGRITYTDSDNLISQLTGGFEAGGITFTLSAAPSGTVTVTPATGSPAATPPVVAVAAP